MACGGEYATSAGAAARIDSLSSRPVPDVPPFGHRMLNHWSLDPDVIYLNHGTVGAPPRRVLAAQQAIRDEIERQPARFLLRELSAITVGEPRTAQPRMRAAADQVAAFLGARGDDLVFVDNATTGVNAVLRSFLFGEGDEILIGDHAYGAIANATAFHAKERGARVHTVELPDPSRGEAAFVECVVRAIGPRTRLAIVDHITSESALVLPIAEIVARCRREGVAVLIDGAHAPGALPIDLPALGADWYVGNLHKWAYAPRSCAFLWAAAGRQESLHRNQGSNGLSGRPRGDRVHAGAGDRRGSVLQPPSRLGGRRALERAPANELPCGGIDGRHHGDGSASGANGMHQGGRGPAA